MGSQHVTQRVRGKRQRQPEEQRTRGCTRGCNRGRLDGRFIVAFAGFGVGVDACEFLILRSLGVLGRFIVVRFVRFVFFFVFFRLIFLCLIERVLLGDDPEGHLPQRHRRVRGFLLRLGPSVSGGGLDALGPGRSLRPVLGLDVLGVYVSSVVRLAPVLAFS